MQRDGVVNCQFKTIGAQMDLITALDIVREVCHIYERSRFGEALDTICKTIESCQLPTTQAKAPAEPTPDGEICPVCVGRCKVWVDPLKLVTTKCHRCNGTGKFPLA